MKVLAEIDRHKFMCEVSNGEVEKFMNLYFNKMERLSVGQEIDLSKGYDFHSETKDALKQTSDFIKANKKLVKAMADGISYIGDKIDTDKHREAISEIFQISLTSPELNMSNYNEEDVADLNTAMIEIHQILSNLVEGGKPDE